VADREGISMRDLIAKDVGGVPMFVREITENAVVMAGRGRKR